MADKLSSASFSTLLWIGGIVCIFVTPALCDVKTLLFVRRYGRYDPAQLWTGPQNVLVGVNDCLNDESDVTTNYIWKGDYRNPIIDNITEYLISDVEMVLYNRQGDSVLTFKDCTLPSVNESHVYCQRNNTNITIESLDKQGGIAGRRVGDPDGFEFLIFNPRHYFSDTSLFNGQKIVVLLDNQSPNDRNTVTGYLGCFVTPQSTTVTEIKPMSIEICFERCHGRFGIQTDRCYCELPDPDTMDEANETQCHFSCDNDSNHFCGHINSSSLAVYKRNAFARFKNAVGGLPYSNVQTVSKVTMGVNQTSHYIFFHSTTYISSVQITEDEECALTNIYFNMTGENQVPRYELKYSLDCSQNENTWDTFNDTLWGINEFLKAGEKPLELGLLKVRCLLIEAIESNYTYARANVTFFGPQGQLAEVAGFAIRAKYEKKVESSSEILPSSTVSEISVASLDSISIEMTTQAESTSLESSAASVGSDLSFVSTVVLETTYLQTGSQSTTMPGDAMVTATVDATVDATVTSTISSTAAKPPLPPSSSSSTPTRSETCMCRCKTESASENKTEEEVTEEKVAQIKKELNVDKSDLSATKMKKESAPDVRTSAQVTGYLGIILLTLIVGMLLLSDVTAIFQHVSMLKSNIQQSLKKD